MTTANKRLDVLETINVLAGWCIKLAGISFTVLMLFVWAWSVGSNTETNQMIIAEHTVIPPFFDVTIACVGTLFGLGLLAFYVTKFLTDRGEFWSVLLYPAIVVGFYGLVAVSYPPDAYVPRWAGIIMLLAATGAGVLMYKHRHEMA